MDWKTELRNNITEAKDLRKYLSLSDDKIKSLEGILEKYPMSIPEYYLSLIDFNDENDPIKKMSIPSYYESFSDGSCDTSGEADNTVITGLQHKYDQTVMILSTNKCAMYCRHCFRKRLVGVDEDETIENFDEIKNYIEKHNEISNILISGGDSFLNSNRKIQFLLDGFTKIQHLDFIRFGTRVPVVFPDRIIKDVEFQKILRKYNRKKQIYVVTQFNHPKEITNKSEKAVNVLLRMGIPVRNQIVLLKGINDSSQILGDLLKGLTSIGVLPYYIFQCRPVTGVKNQFQVPLKKGVEIVEEAKIKQNGQGKGFKFCMSHVTGKIEFIGIIENNKLLLKYHQAKDKNNHGKIFLKEIDDDQSWIDTI